MAAGAAGDGAVALPDGRTLAYREYGDPEGIPVIFYPGALNSRLFTPAWGETSVVAAAAGVRLIALDRPGYGRSSFQAGRSYADNGPELQALMQQVPGLAGRGVALLGYSSGGPNALAAAHAFGPAPAGSGGVRAVGLVSSDGPYVEMEPAPEHLGHPLPITPARASKEGQAMAASLRQSYEALKGRPDRYAALMSDLEEATLQGVAAAEQDTLLERTPWGFRLEDVRCRVLLWHGTKDDQVPDSVARHVAKRLPDCRATFVEGEGHAMIRRQWRSILAQLAGAVGPGVEARGRL